MSKHNEDALPPRSKLISLVLLLCGAALPVSGESPTTGVMRVHDVPTFSLNGAPFLSPAFETYVPEERYFRQFAEAGTKLFCFNANVTACDYGHSQPTWVEADVWDYAPFEERARRVLAAKPDALLLPRMNLGTPRWWLDAHPEALEHLASGGARFDPATLGATLPKDRAFPSLASTVWREAQADALRRFIQHMEDSGLDKHIFGYMLSGLHTEEWYHWSAGTPECAGYSAPTVAAYRAWLTKRYLSDHALRKAWGQKDAARSTALPPDCAARKDSGQGTFRDPATAMPVVDFLTFWNELIPETIAYFAEVAKESTQNRKAVGAFYGYQYEFDGDPEFGHNALGRLMQVKALDFMMVTASYFDRQSAIGADYQRSPALSVQLHGKLWYHDNDTISFLAPKMHGLNQPGRENDPYWGQLRLLGYTPTPEQSRWMFRRAIGFSLCSGMYASFFDLHGGYFDDPELMQEISDLTRLSERLATSDRSSVAEILVVADEDSCAYVTHKNPLLRSSLQMPQVALAQLGAPVDHVLLEDLDRVDPDRYKLMVLNAYQLTDAERRLIARRFQNNGRWLMWCYAPGLFNRNTRDESAMQQLTGMQIETREPSTKPLRMQFLPGDSTLSRELSEQIPEVCGPELSGMQGMRVHDADAQTLAVHPDSGDVCVALKTQPNHTSVYAVTPALPPKAYRALARAAGVHCYNDGDNTLYVNRSLLVLHARNAGEHLIRFPESVTLKNAMTGETLATEANTCAMQMKQGETALIEWNRTDK